MADSHICIHSFLETEYTRPGAKAILGGGWGNLIRYTAYKSVMLRCNEVLTLNRVYSRQDLWVWGAQNTIGEDACLSQLQSSDG